MTNIPNPVENPPENATIRQMRDQIEASNRRAADAEEARKQAEERATALEREKMDEMERLKAERADAEKRIKELEPIRDEHGKYVSAFQNLYQQELQAVPEEHRARLEKLSGTGTWADRVELLRDAKALISTPAEAPARFGTPTNPPIPGATPPPPSAPPAPASPKDWGRVSLAEAASFQTNR